MTDINKSFQKLMDDTFIRYKGNLLERSGKGYIMCGQYYEDLKAVDAALDASFKQWNKSINRAK